MDATVVASLVGGGFTLAGAMCATYVRAKTSNVQAVFTAQQSHMKTLSEENDSLRRRQDSQGEQLARVQEDRARCERDKRQMQSEIGALREEVNRLRGVVDDGSSDIGP